VEGVNNEWVRKEMAQNYWYVFRADPVWNQLHSRELGKTIVKKTSTVDKACLMQSETYIITTKIPFSVGIGINKLADMAEFRAISLSHFESTNVVSATAKSATPGVARGLNPTRSVESHSSANGRAYRAGHCQTARRLARTETGGPADASRRDAQFEHAASETAKSLIPFIKNF
jgi:hypothetical protein